MHNTANEATGRIWRVTRDRDTAVLKMVTYSVIDIASGNIVSRLDQPGYDLASYPLPEQAYDHRAA